MKAEECREWLEARKRMYDKADAHWSDDSGYWAPLLLAALDVAEAVSNAEAHGRAGPEHVAVHDDTANRIVVALAAYRAAKEAMDE